MPYRLSDPAWLAFQNDININSLNLPPWGGVVQWANSYILVYICQTDGTLCRKGEVMLSDVTDRQELLANVPRSYDATAGVWIYQVPAAFMATLYDEAKPVIEGTGIVIQKVSEAVGSAAGAIAKPLVEDLTIPIALAAVALVVVYTRRS
jgi:hypothetical protein